MNVLALRRSRVERRRTGKQTRHARSTNEGVYAVYTVHRGCISRETDEQEAESVVKAAGSRAASKPKQGEQQGSKAPRCAVRCTQDTWRTP
ncbi:hypothetical protein NDU88_004114 [Pleurodeles waltl]|uniref:Uncharacterized protein n=1 Tax=Pleurodeles waltl TaxID=8319 RepID=A0AAV7W6X0_PLEWA|nr:hypothetical protein NDU88_004114 [Pleurodeles waltl]